jgi:hypothetical protein
MSLSSISVIALGALFLAAGLRWFIQQGGASGPRFMKSGDLVLITGVGLACWVGYLMVDAILPLLIALAFAFAVEIHIRESRRRWLDVNVPPLSRAEVVQPVVAQATRIRKSVRLIAVNRAWPRLLPSPDSEGALLPRLIIKHNDTEHRTSM